MKKFSILIVALFLASGIAYAGSYKQAQENMLLSGASGDGNDYDDSSPFTLVYTGTGTACTVTITSYTFATTATNAVVDDISVVFTDSSYDTIGELANYLNGLNYTATLIDARRSEATSLLYDISAQSIYTTAYSVLYDTAGVTATAAYDMYLRIAPSSIDKRVRLLTVSIESDVTSAANIVIYKEDYPTWTETVIYRRSLSNNTEKSAVFCDGGAPFTGLAVGPGDVIVIVADSDKVQTTPSFITATWTEF